MEKCWQQQQQSLSTRDCPSTWRVLPVSVLLKVAMKVIVYKIFCMSGSNQEDLRYYLSLVTKRR